jgi:hypothetical protein
MNSFQEIRCSAEDRGIPENCNDENAASDEAPAAVRRRELKDDYRKYDERECRGEDAKKRSDSSRLGFVYH